jgi:hypothetical protein
MFRGKTSTRGQSVLEMNTGVVMGRTDFLESNVYLSNNFSAVMP